MKIYNKSAFEKSSCKVSVNQNGNRSYGWSWTVQQIPSSNHKQRHSLDDNQLHRSARRPIAISYSTVACKNPTEHMYILLSQKLFLLCQFVSFVQRDTLNEFSNVSPFIKIRLKLQPTSLNHLIASLKSIGFLSLEIFWPTFGSRSLTRAHISQVSLYARHIVVIDTFCAESLKFKNRNRFKWICETFAMRSMLASIFHPSQSTALTSTLEAQRERPVWSFLFTLRQSWNKQMENSCFNLKFFEKIF